MKLLKNLYKFISSTFQNIFRTVYQDHMYIADANVVTHIHQKTFGEYKNINAGKDIAIIATGPSLNKYKPIENTINIGVNKALLYDKVNLDYLFVIDYNVTHSYLDRVLNYPNLKLFYASLPRFKYNLKELKDDYRAIIPESVINRHNAGKFFVYPKYPLKNYQLSPNIDMTWLGIGCSCIFPAMQFALFTNPKRIYIVGCDSTTGHFDEKFDKKPKTDKILYRAWQEIKEFASLYYPETEIISVNPVGLKGLFTDLYQNEENKIAE